MAGVEKLLINGLQSIPKATQKAANTLQETISLKAGSELTNALDCLATTNSILIKNNLMPNIKDVSLLNGEKTKVNIHITDKTGMERILPFLFDSDNSNVLPMQGHFCGNPIQEAYISGKNIRIAPFLRDMQYNNGEFSQEAIEIMEEIGISKNKLLQIINENLTQQEKALQEMQPSAKDCILYRYLDLTFDDEKFKKFKKLLSDLQIGDETILDWSPMYAAGDPNFLTDVTINMPLEEHTIFRILTPKGSKLVHGGVEDVAKEMIFPSKSKFKLLAKHNYQGLNLWDFKYIPPNI